MAETLKVFKNVNDVVPSTAQNAGSAALEIDIVTTSASERAVIKDVVFQVDSNSVAGKGKTRVPTPTLDLDGHTHTTGADSAFSLDGNLIVGPSSTLKIIATPTTDTGWAGSFEGMFFAEGSTGIQYMTGPGTGSPTSMTTKTQYTSSGTNADDAVAAVPPSGATGGGDGSTPYFYRQYSNNIYKYRGSQTALASWSLPSTSYAITADDEYLYSSANGTTTDLYRTSLKDHTYSTLTTGSTYEACQGNQGSYLLHHDGKLWSKREGGNQNLWEINLSGLTVTQHTNSNFNVGSYCDGACIVTPVSGPYAGKALIIEQGTSHWSYFDIATSTVTRVANGTSGSTEYAQGGSEIAPGVALIFTEWSDQCVLIDMNPSTPTWVRGVSTPFVTQNAFGNRFGFAGYMKHNTGITYSAYASGIEIT